MPIDGNPPQDTRTPLTGRRGIEMELIIIHNNTTSRGLRGRTHKRILEQDNNEGKKKNSALAALVDHLTEPEKEPSGYRNTPNACEIREDASLALQVIPRTIMTGTALTSSG